MDRLACVDLPALPLQVALKAHPGWAGHPVAVVEEDAPLGLVTWVNEPARSQGIVPGLKYGEALSLYGQLRATVVSPQVVATAVGELAELFRVYSPGVESSGDEPGVFWLEASGLRLVYPSLALWAQQIERAVRKAGWRCAICVGFTRFGSYALAKSLPLDAQRALGSGKEEQQLLAKVALWQVGLSPPTLATLGKLGVRTVGQFLKLPPSGLRDRFGADAHRLWQLATGQLSVPLQKTPELKPIEARIDVDEPVREVSQLLFLSKTLVTKLLEALAERQLALQSLTIRLGIDRPKGVGPGNDTLQLPVALSEATLDEPRVMQLVRLTLDSAFVGDRLGHGFLGVRWVHISGASAPASAAQLKLLDRPKRDPAAVARGLDKVRAAFGVDSVVRALHGPGHLPEARLLLERLSGELPVATVNEAVETRPLVRRMLLKGELLPPRPTREPDGWLVRGERSGPVKSVHGPFLVSGGWWRQDVQRHYFFLEMQNGEVLWCYFDAIRRRWVQQGAVE